MPKEDSEERTRIPERRGMIDMDKTPDFEKIIQGGLNLPSDKKFYFNGFVVSITPHDVMIILQNNNQPVAFLNTTQVIAKTLMVNLQKVLDSFENDAGMHVPTLDEIQEKLQRKSNANDSGNT